MFINFFARIFRNRWVRTFFGVLVVAVVLWFFGGLIGIGALHPLETELARIACIVVLFAAWLIWNLVRELRDRQRESEIAAGIAGTDEAAKKGQAAKKEQEKLTGEEVAVLTDRLKEAMSALKKSKLGGSRKKLATLPWYMFIGPPGAGKTTALINCGLKFPLAEKEGPRALKGVGGTRNCDWWFTDEAVLIDTAGRYTTQDSQAEVDSAGWLGFLRMLKKQRKRQPLNGVIVAVSLSDLSLLSEEERLTHARAIRRRVRELHDELGVRLPVYVMFTKADLIAGFVEFFDNMGKEEREQVWGATFPLDDGKSEEGAVAQFAPEFDLLLERLNDRMLERVHQEPDIRRRRLIYGFPQQVASLRDVAAEFLNECFRPSRLEARPLLRGAYMASGTQDGNPIDRLLGTMTAEFGLPRQSVAAFSGTGRSYFLTRLVREVIFGEASLVSLDPRVERRAKWTHGLAYGGCALVLLVLGGTWLSSYFGNRDLIAQVHAASADYNREFIELTKRGPADVDMAATLKALNTLRTIHGGYGERDKAIPIALTFGLYQGAKLGVAATDSYLHALNRILLPRMAARLEAQIARLMNNPDALYEVLKTYLILCSDGPLDRDVVLTYMQQDLLALYGSEEETQLRAELLAHMDAMLRAPLEKIAKNEPLVAQAREVLNREPLAEYSYNRLMRSKDVAAIPAWTIAENGEPGAGRVFVRPSGRSLNDGLPGIYTWAGYHNVFLQLLPRVTLNISEDAWVLGRPKTDPVATLRNANVLRQRVLGLYLDDFTRQWDRFIADINVKPFTSVQQGLDQLFLLSAPVSPLRELLRAMDAQTQLSRSGAIDAATQAAQDRAGRVGQRLGNFAQFEARSGLSFRQNEMANILSEVFGTDPQGKPLDPAKRVEEHFKYLHDFVAGDGKDVPMETMLLKMQQQYQAFNQAVNAPSQGQALLNSATPGGSGSGGGGSPAAQLQELSRTAPPAIAAILAPVGRSTAQVTAVAASQELSDAWKSKVLQYCETSLTRYPLVAGSASDAPIDDFVALLGPGGQIDKFFDQYLKPFVDTSQRPWKPISSSTAPLSISTASLLEFERAAQIRDGLFSGGTIQVRFELVPVSLDPAVGQISIDIGGTTLVNNHGPTEPVRFQWPGANGKTGVRVTMTPASGGQGEVFEQDGPWALLRLLDRFKPVQSGPPDRFRITFNGGGGTAVFNLNAGSVRNPFSMAALRSFRCPARL